MNKTVKYDNIVADVKITTHYRPAPPCNNPDSPSFSDMGSDCEFEILKAEREVVDENSGITMYLPLNEEEVGELYEDDDFCETVCDEDRESEYEGVEYENEDEEEGE